MKNWKECENMSNLGWRQVEKSIYAICKITPIWCSWNKNYFKIKNIDNECDSISTNYTTTIFLITMFINFYISPFKRWSQTLLRLSLSLHLKPKLSVTNFHLIIFGWFYFVHKISSLFFCFFFFTHTPLPFTSGGVYTI